ncbi:MAG TPA: hypothetical protein VF077_09105, partial [Nitrospiraceae bacterium]
GTVTFDEAAEEVYNERKSQLQVVPPPEGGVTSKIGEFFGATPPPKKFEYVTPRRPGGQLNPVPMTLDAEGQFSIPEGQRVNGRWYNLGKGNVRQWLVRNGKGGWAR